MRSDYVFLLVLGGLLSSSCLLSRGSSDGQRQFSSEEAETDFQKQRHPATEAATETFVAEVPIHVREGKNDDYVGSWNSVMLSKLVDSSRFDDNNGSDRSKRLSIKKEQSSGSADFDKLLMRLGYLEKLHNGVNHDRASRVAAIKTFQTSCNLPVTGELDLATLHAMQQPRRGLSDAQPTVNYEKTSDVIVKRYTFAHGEAKWRKFNLTYHIENYASNSRIPIPDQKEMIEHALDLWSAVSPFTFIETVEERGDINIKFVKGVHDCGPNETFDGPGGLLGHAAYPDDPEAAGLLHLDDDEDWGTGSADLTAVAAHELGHVLGLGHSDRQSIMTAHRFGLQPDIQLYADDVLGIQTLYAGSQCLKDIRVVYTENESSMPFGAIREMQDESNNINHQFGGRFVWLVPVWGRDEYSRVSHVQVFSSDRRMLDYSNLAEGAGGQYRYLLLNRVYSPATRPICIYTLALWRPLEMPGRGIFSLPREGNWLFCSPNINEGRGNATDYLTICWKYT